MRYYVVVPYIRNEEGDLIAQIGIVAPSAAAAIMSAATKATKSGGAVAFYRKGDRDDYGEMRVLAQFGETPAGLNSPRDKEF